MGETRRKTQKLPAGLLGSATYQAQSLGLTGAMSKVMPCHRPTAGENSADEERI
jgi:hypothetical protein